MIDLKPIDKEKLTRTRSYAGLSYLSRCLDVYKWTDAQGNSWMFEESYINGDQVGMMHADQLFNHLSRWIAKDIDGGSLWINGDRYQR